jgi:hypothetical protein
VCACLFTLRGVELTTKVITHNYSASVVCALMPCYLVPESAPVSRVNTLGLSSTLSAAVVTSSQLCVCVCDLCRVNVFVRLPGDEYEL